VVAATAAVIRWRCEQLGALADGGPAPMLDAMFSRDEPRTGTAGTLAWAVDVDNPATGETFTLTMKEVTLRSAAGANAPAGAAPTLVTRPCAVGFSGNYPRALDGLARLLSLDMRVIDPAWIGMKLRKLLNVGEPLGHFMAPLPGQRRQPVWPSTIAYVARLMIHRYAMLGVLDEEGFPLGATGLLEPPATRAVGQLAPQAGKPCPECGNATMIHKDGCDFCTSCGYVGACG
jgi:ribonucleoside-diphosphate reductase alpha chain